MVIFEIVPVSLLPLYFVSYAKTSEKIYSDLEINSVKEKDELQNDFEIDENGVLVAYHGEGGKVVVPDGVKHIGDKAFLNCESLTKLILPKGLISIRDRAFSDCINLTEVTFPKGLISIGDHAFVECKNLTEVTLPEGLTSIGEGAFLYCVNLTEVIFPERLTSIGDGAFSFTSLTKVVFPEEIVSIGGNVFAGCSYLKEVIFPRKLADISSGTFAGCTSLTKLVLPEGITSIGDNAFWGCSNLRELVLPKGITSIGIAAFTDCDNLTELVLPEGITNIGDGAFSGCSGLTKLILPERITNIGNSVFSHCRSLKELVLPEGITSIGNYAFWNCNSLTKLVLPKGITSVGTSAFEGCSNLTKLVLPEGITSIEPKEFADCNSLTELILPKGITYIGTSAFQGCSSLKELILSEKITSIGIAAFNRCSSLTINCYVGSYVETYAKENNIPYQLIDDLTVGGCIVIDQKANDLEGCTIALSGTLTLEESIEASKANLEAAINSLKFESSDNSKAKVLVCDVIQSQDHRSATLKIWTTLYNKGAATITVTAADGHTSKCEITIAEDTSENNTSYEGDYTSKMREFLINKGTRNILQYLCNDVNFTASTFVAEKDTAVGNLLVMIITDTYYRGWDGWKDLIDGSTSVEDAEKIIASLLGAYQVKVESLSKAKTAQKYAKMINNAFSDYTKATNLFTALNSSEIEAARKYFSEDNIAKLLYEGKYDELTAPINQILQQGTETTEAWNELMEGFTQSAEMSKVLKKGCQAKLGNLDIGGGLSDIGETLKYVSLSQDALNYIYQLETLLTADEMYSEMLLYVKENCVYSVVQEAAGNLYSVINDGAQGVMADFKRFAADKLGEEVLNLVLQVASENSHIFEIIKSGFDWGVTLSNTFFKTGSTQELKDSLRSQVFLANCLGRWVISNEMEYLSAIDTNMEAEKGKEFYYSLYMLWEARKNAEETLQSLLKTTGANWSANYSVSTKITSTLESFQENIFTEESMGNLLGISVSCPVDVEVYNENGTKLLTVKDGTECQGHEKGIYYYCIYNPLSDDYDKYIYYNEDANYNVKIIGNDIGLADCSVSRVTDEGTISEFYFENMEIDNGTVINLDNISKEGVDYKVKNSNGSETSNSMDSRKADKISTLSISLNIDLLELGVGEKKLLKVSFAPTNATNQKVAWDSNNDAVVSVNNDGVITGIKAGTAVVTVSQGDLEQTCKITVKEQNTEYKIDYNLDSGKVSGNPTGYTVDTLPITLKNPTRNGYTFTGWTGSNGNTPQKTVIITKGNTGDKSYTANWSKIESSEESDFDDDSSSGGNNYNLKPINTETSSTGKWIQDQIGWWYKNADGSYPANKWQFIDNKWYFFNKAGYMVTGWILSNNKWYYLGTDGAMVENSWILDKEKWYFLKSGNGDMAIGWILWKNKWYYLNENGDMAVNCITPDGYQVDSNGEWIIR